MTTSEIIVAVATSSAFTGLLVEVVRTIRRAIDKRKNKGLAKLEKDVNSIRQQTIATAGKIVEIQNELATQKRTNLVLLHDRIWDVFARNHDKEYVSVEDKANLEYLFDEYQRRGGNHHAEIMFDFIENKPVAVEAKGEH